MRYIEKNTWQEGYQKASAILDDLNVKANQKSVQYQIKLSQEKDKDKIKKLNKRLDDLLDLYDDADENIRKYLLHCYKNRCAFCGSVVGIEASGEIEHFYPKRGKKDYSYPTLVRDLKNLHLGCKKCNTIKSTTPPQTRRIFSANWYLPNPSKSLNDWKCHSPENVNNSFQYVGHLLNGKLGHVNSKSCAQETIEFFNLNGGKRRFLVEQRLRVYSTAYNLIKTIFQGILFLKEYTYDPCIFDVQKMQTQALLIEFSKMFEETAAYAEMIMDNFGKSFLQCLEIYSELIAEDIKKKSASSIVVSAD